MDNLPNIMLAFGVFGVGMLSPGPAILSVIGTSMTAGRKAGVAQALGIASGAFVWATLSALGLTALITAYASLLTAIKIAGGMYLLWLAFKSFRSAVNTKVLDGKYAVSTGSHRMFFLRGLMVQMTNPKAALTWIAIMSVGFAHSATVSTAVIIVTGGFMLSAFGHIIYAVAFSTNRVVGFYSRARRWIDAALGVFFTAAGLKLLSSRT